VPPARQEKAHVDAHRHSDSLRIDAASATLRALVVQKLRAAITRGVFRPGDRLVERELCERLNVSRPSVREALRQLEAEGLVELVTHRGPAVRAISPQEASELYDLRVGVEALCAQYFAERGSDAEIETLQHATDALCAALRRRDRDRIVEAKNAYYEAFTAGCRSAAVRTLAMQLVARLSYLWATSLQVAGRVDQGISELKAIADAIGRRDPQSASAAAALYVQHARTSGLASMAQTGGNAQVADADTGKLRVVRSNRRNT
jgi:GntR family transcriptional regulator, trigonelline degradation regulator